MRYLLFTSLLFAVTFYSCKDDQLSCEGEVLCTEEFRMVWLELKDAEGEPVHLDSSKTYLKSELIYSQNYLQSGFSSIPYHVVVTDSEIDLISSEGSELQFRGWKEGELVVEANYVVAKDCCHIEKTEGPETLTID